MGQNVDELVTTTHVADVVHHGEKLTIPEQMGIDEAIDVLKRRKRYLQQGISVSEDFNVFPWDGAYALSQVLMERYGWAESKPIQSFFGEIKPKVIRIAVGPDEQVDVPWGQFSIPHVEAVVSTSWTKKSNGAIIFQLSADVIRRDEKIIRELFSDLRKYLRENSIYRGKAIKLRFRDEDGDRLSVPEPEFMDVSGINPENLIYSRELHESVDANLFTPITRVKDCIANGVKIKRGVILGGKYGTGKTLAASVAARLAVDEGITYVYTPRASELGDAIDFARQYQSPACVVFCEDIDRDVSGKRSVKMDDILNILDGIDTKRDNIITVLTTNHLENINKAMLRPGRLDAIIEVTPPDAEAAQRLVRFYGGDSIQPQENLQAVGETLNGQIPAVIEEVVKRAKLFQLGLLDKGAAITNITAEALLRSSKTMTTQIQLLERNEDDEKPSDLETAMVRTIRKAG